MAIFKTLKKEEKKFETDAPEIEDYDEFMLSTDVEPGLQFIGRPYMGGPYSFKSDYNNTGEEVENFRCQFWVVNDENKEVLKTQLKLKSLEDEAKFWEGSVGFELIDSIEKLENQDTGIYNVVTISLSELATYLNNLETITVEVVEQSSTIKGETVLWNTLRVKSTG